MPISIRKALIVYFSPAGSTEHVALVIKGKIHSMETPVTTLDLGREPDLPFILPQLLDAKDHMCLYVGSPVYASHAVPPVMSFISQLPKAENGCSVPFVTWGGVTSGIALYDMGKALEEKGYPALGAAKVLAQHSLMWSSDAPLGAGHPDDKDDAMIEELLEKVEGKLKTDKPAGIPLSLLAYQPEPLRAQMEKWSLEAAKASHPPRQVVKERCTRCGICADRCPMEAIRLSPYPDFGSACVACFNCVRLCPEKAMPVDFEPIFARIRARARQVHESPRTQIFV